MTTEKILSLLRKLPSYFAGGEDNVYSRKSRLWDWILAPREDWKRMSAEQQLAAFESFLSAGSEQTSGVSDWTRVITPELKAYFEDKLDPSMLDRVSMPVTGRPQRFELSGHAVATPFLWNALTVQEFWRRTDNVLGDSCDVVEIGAGYGAAALMWIRSGRVRSYTIIDIEDNLVNSLYYLSQNLADWQIELVERSSPPSEPQAKTLYFLTPGHIAGIDRWKFDVAINSDSIGEMPKETGRAYVAWIADRLRAGGVFLSKNGHRRGRGHLERVSDYGYSKFSLVWYGPSPICSSAFDDFSHFAILRNADPRLTSRQLAQMDILSNLFACGLVEDVEPICDRFSQGALSTEDERFLDACERFFNGEEINVGSGAYGYVLAYLLALRDAVAGRENTVCIGSYLAQGRSEIARVYCLMIELYFHNPAARQRLDSEIRPGVRHYVQEFLNYDRANRVTRSVSFRLRLDAVRKKITPSILWNASPLTKAKNLAFNIRERRGISLHR